MPLFRDVGLPESDATYAELVWKTTGGKELPSVTPKDERGANDGPMVTSASCRAPGMTATQLPLW
jgi:hypothetical protein